MSNFRAKREADIDNRELAFSLGLDDHTREEQKDAESRVKLLKETINKIVVVNIIVIYRN